MPPSQISRNSKYEVEYAMRRSGGLEARRTPEEVGDNLLGAVESSSIAGLLCGDNLPQFPAREAADPRTAASPAEPLPSRSGGAPDSRIHRPANALESTPNMANQIDANDERNSKLKRKYERPVIGEIGGALLELTPWGEDTARERDLERDGRDHKRYNVESGAGGGNTAMFNGPGNDSGMK